MTALTKKTLLWISLFAIAMGFMETAVVVYLRQLYYPEGFDFPLKIIPNNIAIIEFWREFATVIMLVGAGIMAGKDKFTRFAYFILAFAIWDLCYYLFLHILIQWPQSLFTWDILFLIPVPWVGPVLAPCIVSLQMVFFAWLVIRRYDRRGSARVSWPQWLLLISGVIVIIISFTTDYIEQVSHSAIGGWSVFSESQLFEELKTYVPQQYSWWLFWLGDGLCALGVLGFIKRQKQ